MKTVVGVSGAGRRCPVGVRVAAWAALLALPFAAQAAGGEPYEDRWFYCSKSVGSDRDLAFLTNLVRRAASARFNGIVYAGGMDTFWRWRKDKKARFEVFRRSCDAQGIEIVPLIWSTGYGTMTGIDPGLIESKPLGGVPYVRRGDRLVFEKGDTGLANADFERGDAAKNTFAGWGIEAPGHIGYVDDVERHSGSRSVRMETAPGKDPHGHARIWQKLTLKPNRRYRFSVWTKVRDYDTRTTWSFCVQIYNKETSIAGAGSVGKLLRGLTPEKWTKASVSFMTGPSGESTVWMGSWSKTAKGTFWFDDAHLEELPLSELATRAGTPFTVRDARTGTVYAEGKDYRAPVHEGDRVVIGVPAGSAIPEGASVTIDAYVRARAGIKSQISTCMSDPKLYDLFRASADGIVAACNPRKWFLSMDEIRNGGTCPLCAARKTDMAHIVAGCVLRQHEIIRSVRPDAKVYAWSDAFDPWHNAKEQVDGCKGSFIGIWDLIPRDLSLVCWHFGIRDKDLPFFCERGFGIVAGAYYDAPDVTRDERWVETLNRTKGATGILYTTWSAKYDQLENFGNMVWEKGRMPR